MAHRLGTLGSERVVVPAVPGRQESEQQLAKITNIWICNYMLYTRILRVYARMDG